MALCDTCANWAREAGDQVTEHHPACPQFKSPWETGREAIGLPVNGWAVHFVVGKASMTGTSYASLSNGRVIIDVYGHGPDGFVSREEIISTAEAVRRSMLPSA